MATTGVTNAFRLGCMTGAWNMTITTGLIYKILLIKAVGSSGVYDQTLLNVGTPGAGSPTTVNVGTDEASATGYTSGGFAWTAAQNITPTVSSNVAITSWSVNPTWTVTTSLSTISAVVYTSDATLGTAGRTVENLDFGGTQTVTGTLTVVLPANASGTAILRVG
jgi:hypothetical protein